jgi:hypothetical protein
MSAEENNYVSHNFQKNSIADQKTSIGSREWGRKR